MSRGEACAICGAAGASWSYGDGGRKDTCGCAVCGNYKINSLTARILEVNRQDKLPWLLMAETRRHWESHQTPLFVRQEHIQQLTGSQVTGPMPKDKADELVEFIGMPPRPFGEQKKVIYARDYPVCHAEDPQEMERILNYLQSPECGLVDWTVIKNTVHEEPGGGSTTIQRSCDGVAALTMKGWERARELQATRAQPDKAFVAMSFSDKMQASGLLEEGLKPALLACGYEGDKLRLPSSDETLDYAIVADIKRSGLVVADFTEQKQNVYYEAGYAMGLGTPVIRTCHEDAMSALEFDVRQYPVIKWRETSWTDFQKRLVDYATAWGYLAPEPSGSG